MGRARRKKARLPPSFNLTQRASARRRREDQGKGCGQRDEESSIGIKEVEEVTRHSSKFAIAITNENSFQVCGELGYNPQRRTGARLQNILEMDDGSLQQNQCGFESTELLAGSENACPRHRRSRLRSTREKGYTQHEMLVPAGFGISTLTLRLCSTSISSSTSIDSAFSPKRSLDDLYLLLYTHWVLDDSTFKDERQRVQVATGLPPAAFFGCRPCSLFDTRVKSDDPDDPDVPTDVAVVASPPGARKVVNNVKMDEIKDVKSNCDGVPGKSIGADCEIDGGSNKPWGGDSDSDSGSLYGYDEGSDTDDDCNAGPEETRSFLYRHFTISIVANRTPGKPNLYIRFPMRVRFPVPASPITTIVFVRWCAVVDMVDVAYSAVLLRESKQCVQVGTRSSWKDEMPTRPCSTMLMIAKSIRLFWGGLL